MRVAIGTSSELMGDNAPPLSHDKYTSEQYNEIVHIRVTHYTLEKVETMYNSSLNTSSSTSSSSHNNNNNNSFLNMDDPLGGLSGNSKPPPPTTTNTNTASKTATISSIYTPCTEDQVSDLEECIVSIRRCLKSISNKVMCM